MLQLDQSSNTVHQFFITRCSSTSAQILREYKRERYRSLTQVKLTMLIWANLAQPPYIVDVRNFATINLKQFQYPRINSSVFYLENIVPSLTFVGTMSMIFHKFIYGQIQTLFYPSKGCEEDFKDLT